MFNSRGNENLCKLGQEYLNDLLCKFGPFCLQHSKTFDISHAFLRVTIVELSTLKQVRFFGPPCTLGLLLQQYVLLLQLLLLLLDLPFLLIFGQISQMQVTWQQRSIVVKLDLPHSPKPLVKCKDLGDISYTSRVTCIAHFLSNVIAMPIGVGVVERDWLHPIACPPKSPIRCKDVEDI